MDGSGERPGVDRMVSVESGCTSDSWDEYDDYDNYYGNDDEVGTRGFFPKGGCDTPKKHIMISWSGAPNFILINRE